MGQSTAVDQNLVMVNQLCEARPGRPTIARVILCMKSTVLNWTVSPGRSCSGLHLGVEGSVYRQVEPFAIVVISGDNVIASDANGLSCTGTLEQLDMKDGVGVRTGFVNIGDFRLRGVIPFRSRQRLQVFTIASRLMCAMLTQTVLLLRRPVNAASVSRPTAHLQSSVVHADLHRRCDGRPDRRPGLQR